MVRMSKAADPELYAETSRGRVRIRKPNIRLASCPARAREFDGWYEKSFLGEDGLVYQRHRRKGLNGTTERWFLITELIAREIEMERPEQQAPLSPSVSTGRGPGDEVHVVYGLNNMMYEIAEEIDFAIRKFKLTDKQVGILRKIRSRSLALRGMAAELIDVPEAVIGKAASVRTTSVQ